MSGILDGKRILITGVLMESSIAFHAAKVGPGAGRRGHPDGLPPADADRAHRQEAARSPPRSSSWTSPTTSTWTRLAGLVADELGSLDGVVHSIGFAPQDALGGNFLNTPFESVATAMHVSAFSLKSLAMACMPLMERRRLGRRPHLRRAVRLAAVRLDGPGQGRAGGHLPLPRPRPGQGQHPLQPGLGRPDRLHGRQVHPGLRRARGRLEPPLPAGVGHGRPGAGRPRRRRRCSRTSSRRRPARSSTSTAACT